MIMIMMMMVVVMIIYLRFFLEFTVQFFFFFLNIHQCMTSSCFFFFLLLFWMFRKKCALFYWFAAPTIKISLKIATTTTGIETSQTRTKNLFFFFLLKVLFELVFFGYLTRNTSQLKAWQVNDIGRDICPSFLYERGMGERVVDWLDNVRFDHLLSQFRMRWINQGYLRIWGEFFFGFF